MRARPRIRIGPKLTWCLLGCLVLAIRMTPSVVLAQGPVRITLDEAIQLALQHNHTLLAARTTIQQSQAERDDGEPASESDPAW